MGGGISWINCGFQEEIVNVGEFMSLMWSVSINLFKQKHNIVCLKTYCLICYIKIFSMLFIKTYETLKETNIKFCEFKSDGSKDLK